MRRITIGLSLACAVLVARTAQSQQPHPDFSGVWVAPAPAAPPTTGGDPRAPAGGGNAAFTVGDMGSGWGSPLTIAQRGDRLVLAYEFYAPYDLQPPLSFTYALDGSETRNDVAVGRAVQEQRSTTAWAGNTLVITTRHRFTNAADGKEMTAEVRHALTRQAPGSLVVEVTRVGVLGGPTTSGRYVYTLR